MTQGWKSVVPERDRLVLKRADFGGRRALSRNPPTYDMSAQYVVTVALDPRLPPWFHTQGSRVR
jgi:hypothetical protein